MNQIMQPIPEDVINPKVYTLVYDETCNLKYYYNSLSSEYRDECGKDGSFSHRSCIKEGNIRDVMKKLVMELYFPNDNLNEEDVDHDIEWALADSMGEGCELEI